MKKWVWLWVLVAASCGYATEWGAQAPWYMKNDLSDWQHCRERGVDLIGVAKLVSYDPAKTNEYGVEATFQFTDMMKGVPGKYVITIPDSMRNPMNMQFDMASWKATGKLDSWRWKAGETYGCLCISNFYHGIRMVDWVVPIDRWEKFKASVQKERAEFEAFVKEKKLENLVLKERKNNIRNREDLGEEERDVLFEQLSERRSELFFQVQEKGDPYLISDFDWENPDQTWP